MGNTKSAADSLDRLLHKLSAKHRRRKSVSKGEIRGWDEDEEEETTDKRIGVRIQWASSDGQMFVPAGTTSDNLPPAAYEVARDPGVGTYFKKIAVQTTDLVRFPDASSDVLIEEIRKFWSSKHLFEKHKMPYKRGMILWGPPGGGKSATLQFVMQDVIKLGGIVLDFDEPSTFMAGYRLFREIQPDTPMIVLMEDIDATLDMWSESDVLNILDGVNSVENTVFLATTNYPEKLGARILNRPSRFDKRFFIGFPKFEARKIYLTHIFKNGGMSDPDTYNGTIRSWAQDTEGFSIAHLKELYVAVYILGNTYNEALYTLKTMIKEKISSEYDDEEKVGF